MRAEPSSASTRSRPFPVESLPLLSLSEVVKSICLRSLLRFHVPLSLVGPFSFVVPTGNPTSSTLLFRLILCRHHSETSCPLLQRVSSMYAQVLYWGGNVVWMNSSHFKFTESFLWKCATPLRELNVSTTANKRENTCRLLWRMIKLPQSKVLCDPAFN